MRDRFCLIWKPCEGGSVPVIHITALAESCSVAQRAVCVVNRSSLDSNEVCGVMISTDAPLTGTLHAALCRTLLESSKYISAHMELCCMKC